MVKKKVGRPARYSVQQEKEIINVYKKIRTEKKTEIKDLKAALRRHKSLQPLPKSKNFYCNLLRKYGMKHYKLIPGQIITDKVEETRFKAVKSLRRRTKITWKKHVYFFDIKKWSIRTTKNQKEFNRTSVLKGVFRTNQEKCEPWASKPNTVRNRPGSGTVAIGAVIGNGEVFAVGILPHDYKNTDIAKYVDEKIRPALEERGVNKTCFFRRDCDTTFRREAKKAFDRLPTINDEAIPHMQDIMPHDFSVWHQVGKRMIEQEQNWPKAKYNKSETKTAWIKRLKGTLEGLDENYIRKTCSDVYRRVQEIYKLKGKRPRD